MTHSAKATDQHSDKKLQKPPVERAAYTIPEFCEAHRISESMYYKIREAGQGPREARALTKVTITMEAAADWRREREAATATEHADNKIDA